MDESRNAIVIGAGIGGLATAIRLANKGYSVQLFEANNYPGGKATVVEQHGFRWDAGPSLFTLPTLLDELFRECGKKPEDYYTYKQLPIICRYFYPDGTQLDAKNDAEAFAQEIEAKTQEPADNVRRFLKKASRLYDLTAHIFMYRSIWKLKTYLRWQALKSLVNLPLIGINQTMDSMLRQYFKDERVIQLFDRYATYNGSNPYKAPGTLNVIAHLEHNDGAYFLEGGMHALTQALYQLAQDVGVQFHFNSAVEQIMVEYGRVRGVKVDGKAYKADVVVSNMDVVPTYRKLLKDQAAPERSLKQPKSTSALIFYWGLKGSYPQLDLHNILFSGDYPREFAALAVGKVYHDPTIYLYISSKQNKKDALQGHENWFTMINVPANSGQAWDKLIAEAKENMLNKLERMLDEPIRDKIVCEQILDPRSIEAKTFSDKGALYGANSNSKFSAFLRHPNFSKHIRGLYFCGGSVHPGGGIPLCLLSAKIVNDLVPAE